MASCTSFAGQPAGGQAPFVYWHFFPNGTRDWVHPERDNATGLCFYPSASCARAALPRREECCSKSRYIAELPNPATWLPYAVVYPLIAIYVHWRCRACRRRFEARGSGWEEEYKQMEQRRGETTGQERSLAVAVLLGLFVSTSIFVSIYIMVVINEVTQQLLSVTERNSMIVADAVLGPISDVFAFLDDIVLVKIGVALAAHDFETMRMVFFLGVFGGAAMGVVGASLVTVLSLLGPTRNAILNPFHVASGCTLASADVGPAAMYLMLSAWQWPFSFANFAFSGFSLAVQDFAAFGAIGLVCTLLSLGLILTIFKSDPSLEDLSRIRVGCTAFASVLWCLNFALRPNLRRRMGFGRQGLGGAELAEGRSEGFWSDGATKKALVDGLCAMATELSVELASTVGIFVTAHAKGVGAFYQVSANMALQVTTGLALAEGAFYTMKLHGAKLVAAGLTHQFRWLFEFCSAYAFLCFAGSCAATFSSGRALSFAFGAQACVFAGEAACLPEYNDFFGGSQGQGGNGTPMLTTIQLVPFLVGLRGAYRMSKSSLYALEDFKFMATVSVGCFIFAFLPAVIAFGLTSASTLVALLVMAIPNFTVLVAFGLRLRHHFARMAEGAGAPRVEAVKPAECPEEAGGPGLADTANTAAPRSSSSDSEGEESSNSGAECLPHASSVPVLSFTSPELFRMASP